MRPGLFILFGIVALAVLGGALVYPGLLMIGIPLLAIIAGVAVATTYGRKRQEQEIAASDEQQRIQTSDRTVGRAAPLR